MLIIIISLEVEQNVIHVLFKVRLCNGETPLIRNIFSFLNQLTVHGSYKI